MREKFAVVVLIVVLVVPSVILFRGEAQDEAVAYRPSVQPGLGLKESTPVPVQIDSPAPSAPRETVRMKVTAYCLCKICCGKWAGMPDRKTSTGGDARIYDGVAADPKLIPYRTRLEIPGIGIKEVDDTGGAMRQSARKGVAHIDVRMPSHAEARRWGVRWLDVKVLK